jgi:hypothetical protein
MVDLNVHQAQAVLQAGVRGRIAVTQRGEVGFERCACTRKNLFFRRGD